jgi:hypothetical protein
MPAQNSTPITIAGIQIDLAGPVSADDIGIVSRLGPFFGAVANPARRVSLAWEESLVPPSPRGELIYDPGSIWRMYRDGGRYEALLTYDGDGHPAQVRSILAADPEWKSLTLTEQGVGSGWQSLLAFGAGELILRATVLFTAGLIFHASGIDDNGQGIVFVGHSGAGKSTQVGIWSQEPGVVAMNDDRIAVRVEPGGARCYGTPWGGTADIARNHSAPLRAIFVLQQAPENSIQPLSPAAAASLLSVRAFLPYWDASLMRRALTNLSSILASVPIYRLRCRPESAVIPLVRSVLCTSPIAS